MAAVQNHEVGATQPTLKFCDILEMHVEVAKVVLMKNIKRLGRGNR
jgi:hypothetical protein